MWFPNSILHETANLVSFSICAIYFTLSYEALNKLLSNEKYTSWVLLQETISAGSSEIKNGGFMNRYLYSDSHEAITSNEIFRAIQQKKLERTISLGTNILHRCSSILTSCSDATPI